MKKTFIIISVLGIFICSSFAQFNTGTKSVSGTISWSKNTYDGEDEVSLLTIAPSIGYFVMDNIAVNGSLNMLTLSYEGESESITGFGIGAKYYVNNLYAGASYNSLKYEDEDALNSLLIEGGYLYGINESVFLDVGIDYLMGTGDNKLTTITIGVGVATFY